MQENKGSFFFPRW